MSFKDHSIAKGFPTLFIVWTILFIPAAFLLMDVDAGFVDLSQGMRGSYISCSGDACPCEVIEEQSSNGKYYERLGFICPSHVWGVGLFTLFLIFSLLTSLVVQLFFTAASRPSIPVVVFLSLLYWFVAWAILRMIFDAPIIVNDPWEGNYHIVPSMLEYVRPIGWIFVGVVFVVFGFIGNVLGIFVARIMKSVYRGIMKHWKKI